MEGKDTFRIPETMEVSGTTVPCPRAMVWKAARSWQLGERPEYVVFGVFGMERQAG
jgi:hypothetical protein